MARKLVGWKIWYSDGSTFSSAQGKWEDAPIDDIQILMRYYDNGKREIVQGVDIYFIEEFHGDEARKLKWIKFGKEIKADEYIRITKVALNDKERF